MTCDGAAVNADCRGRHAGRRWHANFTHVVGWANRGYLKYRARASGPDDATRGYEYRGSLHASAARFPTLVLNGLRQKWTVVVLT